ncbi:hypothetical protein [Intestinibacillus massiliensis]|uniref:hypothetical protein n=1 Tax=Intestinibacillus massiliensis TaxID=1871029 RepID=UPI000B358B5C|nr:hypothetical protein [Intestinibacillus massiliensis]
MLRKLFKYEWRATSRVLLPLYGSVLVMAIINRLFATINMHMLESATAGGLSFGLPQVIAGFVYGGLIIASFIVTFVLLIQRFYKSLLGDEGYLMFTLPVTVTQHIWVKTFVAAIMCVLSGVATLLSVFILAFNGQNWLSLLKVFPEALQMMFKEPHLLGYTVEGVVWCVAGMLASILSVYLCIAIGHLAKRHRVAAAVGAYFGLSVVGQVVMFLVITFADATGFDFWFANMAPVAAMHAGMLLLIVLTAASGALFFFFTRLILTRRLNLE